MTDKKSIRHQERHQMKMSEETVDLIRHGIAGGNHRRTIKVEINLKTTNGFTYKQACKLSHIIYVTAEVIS